MKKSIRRGWLAAVVMVALALSVTAYLRVLFTEVGYESVGRAWYYFRDYANFGFSPTSLMGTIISPFVTYPIQEPYFFAWKMQGGVLLVASLLVLVASIKYVWPISAAWAVALISSVSILPHMAYNLGNLDNVLALLAVVAVLAIRRTWVVVLACIVGPLFHSMFVFAIYPCMLLLVYLHRGVSWHLSIVGTTMVAMVGVIILGMAPAIDEAAYSALMLERVPGILRDGSFEYFASIQDSFRATWQERREFGFPVLWFSLALAHVVILLAFTISRKDEISVFLLRAFILSAPLALIVLITDIYRVTAWVGFNVMLYVIYMAKYRPISGLTTTLGHRNPGLFLAAVLPWIFLGPMGVTCFADCGATAFPFFKRVMGVFSGL